MDARSMVDKWVAVWEERGTFLAGGGPERERAYVVSMFPYPSGDLHMGHAEAYSIGDAIARFARMRGFDVLHPIGWDSFGLPAENAAIKRDRHPGDWTYANIEVQARSFRRLGISFDWRTRLHTSDPDYYRWNQWLFLRMFERGLAYRRQAPVNWCPSDLTVLANEQVIDGRCERCGAEVVLRPLTQWFLRTTAYAQRLLDDMKLLDWPEDVLAMQRHWIGRSSGGTAVSYRLRDWLVSRQRFWGTPIPIVHCPGCGEVPVPDDELPLTLPEEGCQLRPSDGRSPLATAEAWVSVPCPRCDGPARRDTDTMDTFVDSSWYFLRYPDVHHGDGPFDPASVRRWLPVGDYIGGREHATGHLIYARFLTKVLYDLGLVDFVEPFTRLTNQGHVLMNGRAMSKTLGNLVDLREQIERYGPDAVRLTMLFAGPPGDDIDWADVSPAGAVKFLHRVGQLAAGVGTSYPSGCGGGLRREVHRLVAEATALMERRRLNVAIATLMKLTTVLRGATDDPAAVREGTEFLVRMLSCFAPFTAEEAWERLGHGPSVVDAGWPQADPALTARDTTTCVVQIDGKVRDRLEVPADIGERELLELVLALPRIAELKVARTVVRPPRIVNVLTGPEKPSAKR